MRCVILSHLRPPNFPHLRSARVFGVEHLVRAINPLLLPTCRLVEALTSIHIITRSHLITAVICLQISVPLENFVLKYHLLNLE
jgi:hypothetical protein